MSANFLFDDSPQRLVHLAPAAPLTPPSSSIAHIPRSTPWPTQFSKHNHHQQQPQQHQQVFPPSPASSLPPPLSIQTFLQVNKVDLAHPVSPSSLLAATTTTHYTTTSTSCMRPQAPLSNKLIRINLDPPSPLLLAGDFDDDFDDDDELCLDDEDYYYEDDDDEDEEDMLPFSLALEEDPLVVDRFHPRPLLADPEEPFIAATPVYPTVEALLASSYPSLNPASTEYASHLHRLRRNRMKLEILREQAEREKRQLREEMAASLGRSRSLTRFSVGGQSQSPEENRFRARR